MGNHTKMAVKKIGSCGQNWTKDLASKKGNQNSPAYLYIYCLATLVRIYYDQLNIYFIDHVYLDIRVHIG